MFLTLVSLVHFCQFCGLDAILNGDLDEIIDSLIAADQTAKLAKMNQ